METEPLVRIRCKTPEEEARCVAALTRAGYAPRSALTWLVVPDAHPDRVNEALVAGGAHARVAAREQIGRLIGYLLDRQGDLAGRAANVKNLCERVLSEAGLADRYALRPEPELLAGAAALHAELVATAGGFVSWERFLELFCLRR
ncbi:hypothetical protein [Anaeromyxobacter paludicola]|uniref:Uncharacterized protein n=1 Tax=Anaeromyxobacter paludicola TaxID=2918171 RepID=A0ABN6ND77_9BACT|nr:hypothetical protein [Anaeromyxobacter paludicola]BDG10441.1 hypothetical protein AMPC_35540 [Anaeromyxobacter paludicola]